VPGPHCNRLGVPAEQHSLRLFECISFVQLTRASAGCCWQGCSAESPYRTHVRDRIGNSAYRPYRDRIDRWAHCGHRAAASTGQQRIVAASDWPGRGLCARVRRRSRIGVWRS
jgi:hypothetical protein